MDRKWIETNNRSFYSKSSINKSCPIRFRDFDSVSKQWTTKELKV